MTAVYVGIGGAFGAVARYYVSGWVRVLAGESLPWGTFAVNVLGSFVLGVMLVCLQELAPTEQTRSFAVVGVLGSFTTFSTFSLETVELLRAGDITRAVTYAAGSTALGVIAVVVGISIATVLLSSRA